MKRGVAWVHGACYLCREIEIVWSACVCVCECACVRERGRLVQHESVERHVTNGGARRTCFFFFFFFFFFAPARASRCCSLGTRLRRGLGGLATRSSASPRARARALAATPVKQSNQQTNKQTHETHTQSKAKPLECTSFRGQHLSTRLHTKKETAGSSFQS